MLSSLLAKAAKTLKHRHSRTWRRQRWWRQREARRRGTARRRQHGGSSTEAAAVAAARQRDVGGIGTVRECANTHAFERHRRADVGVFVLGRGWRDDSVDSIIFVATTAAPVATSTAVADARAAAAEDNADGNADNIVC